MVTIRISVITLQLLILVMLNIDVLGELLFYQDLDWRYLLWDTFDLAQNQKVMAGN